eukprot:6170768-Prymnesium_polylepis.1
MADATAARVALASACGAPPTTECAQDALCRSNALSSSSATSAAANGEHAHASSGASEPSAEAWFVQPSAQRRSQRRAAGGAGRRSGGAGESCCDGMSAGASGSSSHSSHSSPPLSPPPPWRPSPCPPPPLCPPSPGPPSTGPRVAYESSSASGCVLVASTPRGGARWLARKWTREAASLAALRAALDG